MHRRISSTEERALGQRLRREAMEAGPAYSETLHHRIMTAIRRRPVEEAAVPRGALRAMRRRNILATALTAACLLAAVVFGWRLADPSPQHDLVDGGAVAATSGSLKPSPPTAAAEATIKGMPLIDELASSTVDNLNGLIASAAIVPQSDDLAHDTRLAAETLLERLPIGVELLAGP